MTAPSLGTPPAWRTVMLEQTRAMGLQLRATGIFLAGVILTLAALTVRVAFVARATHAAYPKLGMMPNLSYAPQVSRVLAAFVLLIPILVWQDEDPSRRTYHWSMPVSRPVHALTRTLAGWIWVMLATAVLLLSWVAITAAIVTITGQPQRHDAGFTAWEWLVTPVAVTVAYLFASAAAIAARRPFVWIFGIPLLYAGTAFLLFAFGMPELSRGMAHLYDGFLGAEAALAGAVDVTDATGRLPVLVPSLGRWLGASLLWGGAGALLVWFVAAWRREPAG